MEDDREQKWGALLAGVVFSGFLTEQEAPEFIEWANERIATARTDHKNGVPKLGVTAETVERDVAIIQSILNGFALHKKYGKRIWEIMDSDEETET